MRITGGIYRSRALRAPPGFSTRPTSDRVREGLFGMLAAAGVLQGARVLDLYAGTGALSLEALSRGAAHAVLVESSRSALAALRANVKALDVSEQTHVAAGDVTRIMERLARKGPFDLVLADPPWALVDAGDVARVLADLAHGTALSRRAIVVLEHAARSTPPAIAGLALDGTRRYGDTALAVYKPAILAPPRLELTSTTSE
ncbi:MAG: 16S rRNA (guanine(966)-N(2))-methyltransferase RsmD [Myxococcota bacterium]|nr:16S rRNA (guanine(966)-N(2))-methyltransferase RsmD [Myxococcota bacterium]